MGVIVVAVVVVAAVMVDVVVVAVVALIALVSAVVVVVVVVVAVVEMMVIEQSTFVALALCQQTLEEGLRPHKGEDHKACCDLHQQQGHTSSDEDSYVCQGRVDMYGWMQRRDICQEERHRNPGRAAQAFCAIVMSMIKLMSICRYLCCIERMCWC